MTELNPKQKPAADIFLEMAAEFERVILAGDRKGDDPERWLEARARATAIIGEANAILQRSPADQSATMRLPTREQLVARIMTLTEQANASMARMAKASYEGRSHVVSMSYEQWNRIVRRRRAAEKKLQKLYGNP